MSVTWTVSSPVVASLGPSCEHQILTKQHILFLSLYSVDFACGHIFCPLFAKIWLINSDVSSDVEEINLMKCDFCCSSVAWLENTTTSNIKPHFPKLTMLGRPSASLAYKWRLLKCSRPADQWGCATIFSDLKLLRCTTPAHHSRPVSFVSILSVVIESQRKTNYMGHTASRTRSTICRAKTRVTTLRLTIYIMREPVQYSLSCLPVPPLSLYAYANTDAWNEKVSYLREKMVDQTQPHILSHRTGPLQEIVDACLDFSDA